MIPMHKALGHQLWSIGWDVMVRGDQPIFIEFNINNGFFLADHSIDECEQMANFYEREVSLSAETNTTAQTASTNPSITVSLD